MEPKYLSIPSEQFVNCYNDFEFVEHIEVKGNEKNQLEYLKWGAAKYLLSKHFPTFQVEFEKDDVGLPAFRTPNNLLKEEAKDAFFERIANLKVGIEEDKVTLSKTDKRDQWKVEKEIKAKQKEIVNTQNQLFYDNSGYYLKPFLVDAATGLKTPSLFFPLMDYNNDPIYQADSRDISDNIQRALVKCIAYYTGIGLLIYTRGAGIGKDPVTNSAKWKIIEKIIPYYTLLSKEVDKSKVNFGVEIAHLNRALTNIEKEYQAAKKAQADKLAAPKPQ